MKMNINILLLAWIISPVMLFAQQKQSEKDHVRKGNGYYKKGEYSNAIKQYDEALKKNDKNEKAGFNKGDALYRDKNFPKPVITFSIGLMSAHRNSRVAAVSIN